MRSPASYPQSLPFPTGCSVSVLMSPQLEEETLKGEQECHNHGPDEDSNYVNNTSEEEEGITYNICYCPEDNSYLEGRDCNGEEYLAHGMHRIDTDTYQEHPHCIPPKWTDHHCAEGSQDYLDGHLPILEDELSVLEAHDQEEDGYYYPSKEGYQGYHPPEANGNTGASPFHLRHGDGDLEDQEEDIDPIVAKIERSLSMTSITSASEASPEHRPEPGPGDSAEACMPSKASCRPSRHKVKPKSLNLPPEAKHCEDPQRGFKPKTRTQRRGRSGPTSR
ncbi:Amyloid-beta A4 precursor protein-binding A member 2 [Saguinus oedipus]|uniref:Amyloid-beta A4 protein-binding A member 2 n=1 Tax=Saguinus oedipus TaxID=9490 RepID=A0ABQ9TS28_SAGOE|nr:Amyloid-beta A4 precursor protein-binding A member 2 [Saguinus oedipus]